MLGRGVERRETQCRTEHQQHSEADLAASLTLAAKQPLVKGFAIGRTIFGDAARAWLKGQMTDAAAVQMMSDRYARLAALWDKAREGAKK